MWTLLGLKIAVLTALALGHRAPGQAAPQFDHTGLRWRILHGERFGPGQLLEVVVSLFVLWVAWIEIFAILWVVGGRPLGTWMIQLPAAANLVALVAVPLLLRASWTEIDADPVRLRIRGRTGAVEVPWAEVTEVRAVGHQLIVRTATRRWVLDAPQAAPDALVDTARWLEAGRRAPFPAHPPPDPAPPDMVALVSRAGARSARRAAVE